MELLGCNIGHGTGICGKRAKGEDIGKLADKRDALRLNLRASLPVDVPSTKSHGCIADSLGSSAT